MKVYATQVDTWWLVTCCEVCEDTPQDSQMPVAEWRLALQEDALLHPDADRWVGVCATHLPEGVRRLRAKAARGVLR